MMNCSASVLSTATSARTVVGTDRSVSKRRSGPGPAERIRAYARAKVALIVLAEDTLTAQAMRTDLVRGDGEEAFRRVEETRRALGPTLLAAVDPLLPLSRNDQWEIRELHERLTGR